MNLRDIDYLIVVSDPSARGIMTAKRIAELTGPLGIQIKKKCLIVNRVPEPAGKELLAKIDEAVQSADLPLGGLLPASNELVAQEIAGKSFLKLDGEVPVVQKAFAIFDALLG
jgi:CO dehydrogenase maturation factor